ncbi:MAG: hypothetical protein PHS61_04875 [Candidatus Omnitrophica bacterium]|nr:hypothetical protein [Candidatus Omnitrophota bacterium]
MAAQIPEIKEDIIGIEIHALGIPILSRIGRLFCRIIIDAQLHKNQNNLFDYDRPNTTDPNREFQKTKSAVRIDANGGAGGTLSCLFLSSVDYFFTPSLLSQKQGGPGVL